MARGQLSFVVPPSLMEKLEAEKKELGYAKMGEVVREILVKHFAEKEKTVAKAS